MESLLIKTRIMGQFLLLSRLMNPIEGFLTEIEGYMLYSLAREGEGMGEIVELGSYMGRSTCHLALGSKQAGREKVTAIDTFQGSPEHQAGGDAESEVLREEGTTFNRFQANLAHLGLSDDVNVVQATSEDAVSHWQKPIRLLFIDADHSYEACLKDYSLWAPHVVNCGLIAFHDYGQAEGVTRLCNELRQHDETLKELSLTASLFVFQKNIK